MLNNLALMIEEFITGIGIWAPIVACFLILIESMLPVLPLCTFITINFISFGNIGGFIISWVFTCLGCLLSYFFVKKGFSSWYRTRLNRPAMLDRALNYVNNLSFPKFTTILAMPFTPAFMINIAAGLTNMNFKKFLVSILISKIFMVYFWGYVGVGLLESLSSPLILSRILGIIIIAYAISKLIDHFFNEE